MHGVSLSVKDGEDHEERIFSFKEPIVTFRMGPSVAELQAQMQRDLGLSLLGESQAWKTCTWPVLLADLRGGRFQGDGPANGSQSPEML